MSPASSCITLIISNRLPDEPPSQSSERRLIDAGQRGARPRRPEV